MKKTLGFTLIELLVTATIISLLTTIGIVGYQVTGKQSRDAKRKADLEQIRVALEMIREDCDSYPGTAPPWGSRWEVTCKEVTNAYMEEVPQDPKAPTFIYVYSSGGVTYSLCAYLENSSGDVGCGGCGGGQNCNYKVTNP